MSARPSNDDLSREADPRFPSGRWVGWWEQDRVRGKMELLLQFANGRVFGEGRDSVGDFMLSGGYSLDTGSCVLLKAYLGQHDVDYDGAADESGIRGAWTIKLTRVEFKFSGPFRIWPVGSGAADTLRVHTEEPQPLAL